MMCAASWGTGMAWLPTADVKMSLLPFYFFYRALKTLFLWRIKNPIHTRIITSTPGDPSYYW